MKNEIGKNYDPDLIEDMIYSWWEEKQYFKPENPLLPVSYWKKKYDT